MAMTLAAYRAYLRSRLSDPLKGSWSDTELTDAVNLAVHQTEIATRCLQEVVSVPIPATFQFAVTSASAAAGAVYSNAGAQFTVVTTIAHSITLVTTGYLGSPPLASGTLGLVSGTGDANIAYSACIATVLADLFDASPLFEIEDVRLGTVILTKSTRRSMRFLDPEWDQAYPDAQPTTGPYATSPPVDAPTIWWPEGGSQFGVWPVLTAAAATGVEKIQPSPVAPGTGYAVGDILNLATADTAQVKVVKLAGSAAVSLALIASGSGYALGTVATVAVAPGSGASATVAITALTTGFTVMGLGVSTDLSADTDVASSIPAGDGDQAVLDRAEAEARERRANRAGNMVIAQARLATWNAWCQRVVGGRKS